MRIFKLIFGLISVAFVLTACTDNNNDINPVETPEPPLPVDPVKPNINEKVFAISIDGQANFEYLTSKAAINTELKKIKEHGFNTIYLDVKPANGRALYKSNILKPCNSYGGVTVERDYDDYLGYFIEKGKELDIDIVATIFTCVWGHIYDEVNHEGFIFDNLNEWRNEIQVRNDHGTNNVVSNLDENNHTLLFVSPASTKFQSFILNVIGELVTNYPGLKGVNLDYLRYAESEHGWYGMGDLDLEGYAQYWNESKPKPEEIVEPSGGTGPKFERWVEYRSATVKSLLEKIRNRVKSINPDCEIQLWASSDWPSRYCVGQNWGSMRNIPSGYQYTTTYHKTGFAHLLDTFVSGAYAEQVWEYEDPTNVWCVEKFCKHWNDYIMGECKCVTAVPAYAYIEDPQKMTDATYLALKYSNGVRAFELSHINNGNLWDAIVKGYERYIKEYVVKE